MYSIWDSIGKGESKDFIFHPTDTVRHFAAKLASARENLLFESFSPDSGETRENLDLKEGEGKIQAEFIEGMRGKRFDKGRIREEEGHLHLSMLVVIRNPRDVAVEIEDIRYDLDLAMEKYGKPFVVGMAPHPTSLCLEPEVYEIKSDRSITALILPFTMDSKERIILLISFRTHYNVLDLSLFLSIGRVY